MRKLIATTVLLMVSVCMLTVHGQSTSTRGNKPSLANSSVARALAMEREAHRLADEFWRRLTKCGSSYFLYTDDGLIEFRESPHFTFWGEALKPKSLTRVDVLNGVDPLPIEWDGGTNVSFEVCRMN